MKQNIICRARLLGGASLLWVLVAAVVTTNSTVLWRWVQPSDSTSNSGDDEPAASQSSSPSASSSSDTLRHSPTKHELYFGLSVQHRQCEAYRSMFLDSGATTAAETTGMMRSNNKPGVGEYRNGDVSTDPLAPTACHHRTISDVEFEQFIEQEVVPRFPDGFTILDGTGFYGFKGNNGESDQLKVDDVGAETSSSHASKGTTPQPKAIKERCKILVVMDDSGGGGVAPEAWSSSSSNDNDDDDANKMESSSENRAMDSFTCNNNMNLSSPQFLLTPTHQGLLDIAGLYKWYFNQESVMWVESGSSRMSFV